MCCSGPSRRERRGYRAAAAGGVGVAVGLPGSADPVPAAAWRPRRGRPPRTPVSRRQSSWPACCPATASGREALLDWLAGQDGGSWQQRWLASGADAAAAAWWQLPRDWLRRSGSPVPTVAPLVSALIAAICADIVRPSLAWLVAGGRDHGELTRVMAVMRDPDGFARLRAVCDSDPAVSNDRRQPHAAPGRGHPGRQGRRARRCQDR